MVRVKCKPFGIGCPDFADVFVAGEATQGFEAAAVIVGIGEVVEVRNQLGMAIAMIAFDGSLLDRAVHALDLTVGPGMFRLGKASSGCTMAPSIWERTRLETTMRVPVLWQDDRLELEVGSGRRDRWSILASGSQALVHNKPQVGSD